MLVIAGETIVDMIEGKAGQFSAFTGGGPAQRDRLEPVCLHRHYPRPLKSCGEQPAFAGLTFFSR